jgi:hypothetical protein
VLEDVEEVAESGVLVAQLLGDQQRTSGKRRLSISVGGKAIDGWAEKRTISSAGGR